MYGLLRARQSYTGLYDELAYWAPTQGGTEVDSLLRRGEAFVAIEVKATTRPSPPHVAGLRAIADLAGVKRRVLVHMGERPFNTPMGSKRCRSCSSPTRCCPDSYHDDDFLSPVVQCKTTVAWPRWRFLVSCSRVRLSLLRTI